MKKIKNIRQLRKEEKRLQQREKELKQQISSGWKDIKKGIQPWNILKEQLGKYRQHECEKDGDGLFNNVLSYAITLLTSDLARRTEKKMKQFFG